MVIPVGDQNPLRRTPVVTYLLITVNVAVFLLSPLAGTLTGSTAAEVCAQTRYTLEYGAVPDELLSNEPLGVTAGDPVATDHGVACERVPASYEKVPVLSVLTAMFVHGGWLHLLGNMLFLGVFGNNVEDRMGRLRYLLFYLGAGYVATYAYALLNPGLTTPLVGASGAIAGVLGAYLLMFPRALVTSLVLLFIPVRLPAWIVLGLWFLIQWSYAQGAGVTGGADVAYEAHVAGFLAGMLAVVLGLGRRRAPPYR